jgi:hypothetical protein
MDGSNVNIRLVGYREEMLLDDIIPVLTNYIGDKTEDS